MRNPLTHEGDWGNFDAMRNQAHELDALKNGSTTDTLQWCQLHRGHCHDVVPIRRHFEDPTRQDEIFLACQKCIRDLKKAELITSSKYAKVDCYEVVVPKGLSKGQGYARRDPHKPRRPEAQRSNCTVKRSFEVTLDALQVKYLRALGFKVIPA